MARALFTGKMLGVHLIARPDRRIQSCRSLVKYRALGTTGFVRIS